MKEFTDYQIIVEIKNFVDITGSISTIIKTASTQSFQINTDDFIFKNLITRNPIKFTA